MAFDEFVDLRHFPLDEELRSRLYEEQVECAVVWSNADGWPLGVMHWFVWRDGRFWVTVTNQRKRVAALRRRPHSAVIVSGVGTSLGPGRTVTAKTRATIHDDDDETKSWFYPALAAKAWGRHPEQAEEFERMLFDTPRVVIELEPVRFITFDARAMYASGQD